MFCPTTISPSPLTIGSLTIEPSPKIKAETKSILEIAKEIAELATATREGTLKPQQMQGSTITISNIGSARGSWFTPIINGSDVVILGLGSIVKEPIVNGEGEIVVPVINRCFSTIYYSLLDFHKHELRVSQ